MSRLLVACAACILFYPGRSSAVQLPFDAIQYLQSEYLVDSWQTEQGLPDNYVNAITQTPDGYLWIGTFNGLARFNGVEFVVFDSANTPELPSSRITRLHTDRNGRLWIMSEYGDLSMWSEGRFRSFPIKPIRSLRQDYHGTVFTAAWPDTRKYYYFTNEVFQAISTAHTFYERLGNAYDPAGHGWGIQSNRLFSVDPGARADRPIPNFDSAFGWRLVGSSDGGVWVISEHVQKFRDGSWDDYGTIPVITQHLSERLIEDRNGNLWIGTGVGELWRLGTNRVFRRFKLQNSTALELGKSMFQDAEANLWVGTSGSGLLRLKPRVLKTYDSHDGLKSDIVRSVTQDRDGNIWLVAVNSIDWFPPQSPNRAEARGVTVSLPWNIYADRGGTMWVGTFSKGLLRLQGNAQTWFKAEGHRDTPVVNAIFEDRQGQILLGTPMGLYGIESDQLVPKDRPANLEAMDVRTIAEDSLGQLYVGLDGEGLLRKTKTGWDRFTTADGLAGNHVWGLYIDKDDAAWFGMHGHGLGRFKNGKFFNFAATAVELPRIINCILEDDTGHLWFESNQGLFRANRNQLNELADGRTTSADVTHYNRADGMGSSQCTGNGWKARDAKLWFATMGGVSVVDPGALPFNSRPPPVVIERVLIDDKPLDTTANIKVPVGAHRIEFRYAGLSFTVPERVRFQYRLEGFDKDWIKPNTERSAYYSKLPPGSYRFQVKACNNDNVWGQTVASVALVVMPHFWQTAWFAVVALFGAGGLSIGSYKLRVMQLERQRAAQERFSRRLLESQEEERKRIAAELHDSLGQSLLVVKNYAYMALKQTTAPDKVRDQLQEISETTSASIEEVRSIARALRPYQLDRFGLTKTLEDAADLLAKASSLKIETQIDDVDATFSPDAQISIFRIVQEWLNNVVKHAQATTAQVLVRNDNGTVHFILQDDGIGFDYVAVMNRIRGNGSFGLANLRERVRLLGGSLKIETGPGKGTRLLIHLPGGASVPASRDHA